MATKWQDLCRDDLRDTVSPIVTDLISQQLSQASYVQAGTRMCKEATGTRITVDQLKAQIRETPLQL